MKHSPEFITALIIIFGAIVHATAQLKIARDTEQQFTWLDFLILTVIAGFAGLMFGLTSTLFFDNQVMVMLSSGIGAFLGIAGLNTLGNIILDVIASRIEKKK